MLNINSHQKNYRLKNVKTYLISSVVINENKDQLIFACHACNAEDPSSIPGSGSSAGGDIGYPPQYSWASLVAQLVKNPPSMWRPGFDPLFGKIPWRRERLPLQYSGLENSMCCIVHRVAISQTGLSNLHCIINPAYLTSMENGAL